MANSLLTLKKTEDMRATDTPGRRKIDPSEWPQLLARREQGATQAEIAREYGVSQGTVSQILKRAREQWRGAPDEASGETPANDDKSAGHGGTLSLSAKPATSSESESADLPADESSALEAREAPVTEAPVTEAPVLETGDAEVDAAPRPAMPSDAREGRTLTAHATARQQAVPRDTNQDGAVPTAGQGTPGRGKTPQNPLAVRLSEAARRVTDLVDVGGGTGDQLADAMHEVRRALAAIEIDAAKRASAAPRPVTAVEPEPFEDDGKQLGRIKFFKGDKGFGFIIPDDGGEDVFLSGKTVSAAGIEGLSQGDRVLFEPGPGSKGTEAKNIERAD